MADLEAVLADVSYLMAMEKSKSTPAARASKRISLPDSSVRSIMRKYMNKNNEITFDKIFNQRLGFLLFKEYCEQLPDEQVPYMKFYEEIKKFESLETDEERCKLGREIYDTFIMKDLLSQSHIFKKDSVSHVQERLNFSQKHKTLPVDTFQPYRNEIMAVFRNDLFSGFITSVKFTRFTQWKNLELNINRDMVTLKKKHVGIFEPICNVFLSTNDLLLVMKCINETIDDLDTIIDYEDDLTMNDFGVHRIIGRGGFGEVYGCRKADTGKMYAMKCLDKKRIKMKRGETLALNERIMLSLVSTGEGSPFIVCMTYAFQTTEKLCFILDLMNGGDLHYHLSQHNVFSEKEVRFYASEIILGLEHMHSRSVVYRDLKPANILLDENGHVRISDLGLACDFSKKRPYACVGTHGYMAPEVLQKGQSYDSSADWFSLGCMLYKLLKGHSPFRHFKTRDKHEIDKMTLTMNVDLSESLTPESRSLLESLLSRDVDMRLGCRGQGAQELKDHVFFKGIDWQQVYMQKCIPPLVPPRGEVNAADAFDIGSFDEEDTKGIKLTESDQDLYKNFPLVVSERWQLEITETVFDAVNQEADRIEAKRRNKLRHGAGSNCGDSFDLGVTPSNNHQNSGSPVNSSILSSTDCIVEGEIAKLGGPFLQTWQKRYLKLFPNRLEIYVRSKDGIINTKGIELISMLDIKEIHPEFQKVNKMDHVIAIILKNDSKIFITSNDKILICQWKEEILNGFKLSNDIIASMNRKAHKMYGTDVDMISGGCQSFSSSKSWNEYNRMSSISSNKEECDAQSSSSAHILNSSLCSVSQSILNNHHCVTENH